MITLNNIALRQGKEILLENVNWTIYHGQRFGIIGSNGAGKTSLFALLCNELAADKGDLIIPKHLKITHVAQETPGLDESALDFVLNGDYELRSLEKQLAQAETANDGFLIGSLHEKLSIIDAYSAPARAQQLLDGLGFKPDECYQPVKSFSGGWRVRLNLAQALIARADVLLLDEPTNHLDLDAVIWLEKWLKDYPGTLLLISHDRDFLDQTVNHIAHFDHKRLEIYAGNYSTFEKTRANKLMLQQAVYEKQQKQLSHMQSYVDRFRYKASKARQAQSRLKAIERMDLVCAVQTESPFQFEFKMPKQCPNPLIKLEYIDIAYYADEYVLKNISLSLSPKDRIGIIGPNGAGKSTFIKMLAGILPPTHGVRELSSGLKIGYFAQHQIDHLTLSESPLWHLREIAVKTAELELRTYLGSFGFPGEKVLEPVRKFSGGEKTRLALALLIWQKPNLLLLDEPTNHLDLEMRNALSIALQAYEGAMLLVSHDRFLVRTTTDQLWLVANKALTQFEGDLQDYQQWLLDFRKQDNVREDKSENKLNKREQRQTKSKEREALRPVLKLIQQLESDLARQQKKLIQFEETLADPVLYTPEQKQSLKELLQKKAYLEKEIKTTEDAWLAACEQRDQQL